MLTLLSRPQSKFLREQSGPPVLALLDIGEWQDDERRALVDLIRAKGGRSERDYLARYQAHARLDAAFAPTRLSIDVRFRRPLSSGRRTRTAGASLNRHS
jgi:hypothetical protein